MRWSLVAGAVLAWQVAALTSGEARAADERTDVGAAAASQPAEFRPAATITTGRDMGLPAPTQAHATVHFRNDVGRAFRLVEARFLIDGQAVPIAINQAEPGQDFVVFTGPVTSGRHVITSHLTYQGRDSAIFTYLKGYTFNLDSREEVNTQGDSAVSVTIVGKEHKGFNVAYEKRLGIGLEDNTATAIGRRTTPTSASAR
jgi:hypothetical protein